MASLLYHSKHVKYFQQLSFLLPHHYTQLESSRLTALYFVVVALDLLQELEKLDCPTIIDFVYLLQIFPKDEEEIGRGHFGFLGGTHFGYENAIELVKLRPYQTGHLAMTYTALMTLLTLGDNLERIDRVNIGKGV